MNKWDFVGALATSIGNSKEVAGAPAQQPHDYAVVAGGATPPLQDRLFIYTITGTYPRVNIELLAICANHDLKAEEKILPLRYCKEFVINFLLRCFAIRIK